MENDFNQKILELAPMGYAYCETIFDDNGKFVDLRYLDVNNAYKTIIGFEDMDIRGKKRSDFFPVVESDWERTLSEVIHNQSSASFKFYSKLLKRHLKIEFYTLSKDRIVIFGFDITKEVIDSIEKAIILKSTSDIIVELDEDYLCTNVYTNAKKNLFIEKEDLIHRNVRDIFDEDTANILIEAFVKAKQTGESASVTYEGTGNYAKRWFRSSVFYVLFDQTHRYIVSTHDVTKQKLIENQLIFTNKRLTEIAHQTKTVIWEVDKNGVYTYVNSMSRDVYGYEPEEMIGKLLYDNAPEETREEFKIMVLDIMNRNEIVREFESPYITKSGQKIWLLSYGAPIFDEKGTYMGYRGSNIDITEKHNFQLALLKSEEKYRFITENTSDVIWILNLNTYRYTYISQAIFRLRGITVEEAMVQDLKESISPKSWDFVQNKIETSLGLFILDPDHNSDNMLTIQQIHKDGSELWVEVSARYRFNEQNEIEIFGISRNITERKKVDDEIRFLSFHDQLTGLYNRRYYELELRRLNTQRNLPISIIVTDINGLKMTNDVFGHEVGDELIRLTSEVLRDACREDEIIVRTGGDEFLILLPKTKIEDCEKVVDRIHQKVNKIQDNEFLLSLSIGYSSKELIEQDIVDVTIKADRDMYEHKLVESEIHKRQLLGNIMNRLYKLDPDLRRHLKSMTQLVTRFGEYLNLKYDQIEHLKLAAMYHDIGKIGIDEKDVKLYQNNPLEFGYLIKRQPELSYQILRYISEYSEVANIILAYHENYDGSGYPKGLKGNEISMESMIIHIANSFDKLRYKLGLDEEEALERLMTKKNYELEPYLCDQFSSMIRSNSTLKQ